MFIDQFMPFRIDDEKGVEELPFDDVMKLVSIEDYNIDSQVSTDFGSVFFLENGHEKLVLKVARSEWGDLLDREAQIYLDLHKYHAPIPDLRGYSGRCLLLQYVPSVSRYDDAFLLEAAKELLQIHDAGYVHRDVKENNFLSQRVIDFNLSHKKKEKNVPKGGFRIRCSPEVLLHANPSFPTDVYSFGCMVAYCANGVEISKGACAEEYLFQRTLPKYNDLVTRCTRTDPDKRIHMDEVVDYFEKVLD